MQHNSKERQTERTTQKFRSKSTFSLWFPLHSCLPLSLSQQSLSSTNTRSRPYWRQSITCWVVKQRQQTLEDPMRPSLSSQAQEMCKKLLQKQQKYCINNKCWLREPLSLSILTRKLKKHGWTFVAGNVGLEQIGQLSSRIFGFTAVQENRWAEYSALRSDQWMS